MIPFAGWASTAGKFVNKGSDLYSSRNVLSTEKVESIYSPIYQNVVNSPLGKTQNQLDTLYKTHSELNTPNALMFNLPPVKTDIPTTIKSGDADIGAKGTDKVDAQKIINKDGSVTIKGEGVISEVIDNRPYQDPKSRPSFRKRVPEVTFENAKGPDGLVRDPLYPEKIIEWEPGQPRKNVWDMGHLPEHKYSDMHKRYLNGDLTPKELRDWYNNPDNYRPELPSTNRSHKIE